MKENTERKYEMTTFINKLEKYAALAVEVGVNIQTGQNLYIASSIDSVELVRLITKKAYEVGAKQVFVDFSDDQITRLRYDLAPADSFSFFPSWKAKEEEILAEDGAAFMSIMSQSPDLLKGIDSSKIAAFQKAAGQALINIVSLFNQTKLAGQL